MRRTAAIFLALAALVLPASAVAAGPPTVQYFTPSPIRNHEATLRFSIDPEGLATDYEVKYGTAPGEYNPFSFWEFEMPAGDEPVMVEAKLPAHWMPALHAGTKYHWTVIAENSAGKTEGPEQTFTTTNGPHPGVITGAATDQTLTSATFTGTVDPEGFPLTACRFRYVTETTAAFKGFEANTGGGVTPLGNSVPCEESLAAIGSGDEPVAVHADVSGLEPGPYRFRLEADNEFEKAGGGGVSFGPPLVLDSSTNGVAATEATIWAQLEKYWAGSAQYRVQYAAGGIWQQTPWVEAPQATFPEVTIQLTCLWPSTEYRFRVLARNQAGTTFGPEGSFTTLGGGVPACLQPPAALPPAALPPAESPKPGKKKRKKHQRKRVRHNATIVAPR